ncbi:hypothetical protein IQ272_03325 [Chroococcidiopsidales cyanobacterium LEGE 13417]|nr:hypothetical protein [Chroococcidiopsidales cyanobacterium LEGE 13417]
MTPGCDRRQNIPARSSLRLLFQKPLCVFARQLLQRGKPHASRTAVATTGGTPATRCLLNGGNPRTALAPQRTGSSLRDPKSYFVKL